MVNTRFTEQQNANVVMICQIAKSFAQKIVMKKLKRWRKQMNSAERKRFSRVKGNWIDILLKGLHGPITLDTQDGVRREGRLSGFSMRTMRFNNVSIDVPTEIELNGDINDRVPLDRIIELSVGLEDE